MYQCYIVRNNQYRKYTWPDLVGSTFDPQEQLVGHPDTANKTSIMSRAVKI